MESCGASIIRKGSLNAGVTPTDIKSQKVCAVFIEYDNINVLLICVYMPCDENRPNPNIIEYKSVVNNNITVCNGADTDLGLIDVDEYAISCKGTSCELHVYTTYPFL